MPSKRQGFFCIEGKHLLEELLNAGISPTKVIATEEWLLRNNSLVKKIDNYKISKVTKDVLTHAITTKNPDGVAALIKISLIKSSVFDDNDDFVLVLDRIQDPGNLGNLFRTALAAGVDRILLVGGANPLSPKVLRASCGTIFHLPYIRLDGDEDIVIGDLLKTLSDLQKKGFQIVLTSVENRSSENTLKPYWELDWLQPTVLILGNEGSGIHNKIKKAFNETITIPHNELVESLNVACAAVPLLLERNRVSLTSNSTNKRD